MKLLRLLLILVVASFGAPTLHAAEEKPSTDPPTKLAFTPMGEPTPVLKYPLLPPLADCRPGNAAVMYNKLGSGEITGKAWTDLQNKLAEWIAQPADKLDLPEIRRTLGNFKSTIDYLDLAARRDHCNWELPIYERKVVDLILPEVQMTRSFARLMAMQARLQVLEGNYDGAIRSLQTGLAIGRDVAEGPTLINGLVGLSISSMCLNVLQDWIVQPNAPNLYWSLTTLPHPLIDSRRGMEGETAMLILSYPGLNELDQGTTYSPKAQAAVDELLTDLSSGGIAGSDTDKAVFVATLIKTHPAARARLIAAGRDESDIDKMKPIQVIAIDSFQQFQVKRDRHFRWMSLPFWIAKPKMDAEVAALKESRENPTGIPLAELLLPAIGSASFAYARVERQIAGLRNVEAIRLYAAAHEGKLPEKLAEVPAPVASDPVSGQEFEYQLTGETGSLQAPRPAFAPTNDKGLKYELSVRKPAGGK